METVTVMETASLLHTGDLFDGLHPNTGSYRKIAALQERRIDPHSTRAPTAA